MRKAQTYKVLDWQPAEWLWVVCFAGLALPACPPHMHPCGAATAGAGRSRVEVALAGGERRVEGPSDDLTHCSAFMPAVELQPACCTPAAEPLLPMH